MCSAVGSDYSVEVPALNPADHEFTQLIKGFTGEKIRQSFRYFDTDDDGYIQPAEFQRIIVVRTFHCSPLNRSPARRRLRATN